MITEGNQNTARVEQVEKRTVLKKNRPRKNARNPTTHAKKSVKANIVGIHPREKKERTKNDTPQDIQKIRNGMGVGKGRGKERVITVKRCVETLTESL